MKHFKTFESFLNEERVYGMFNDSQGKPSKLSQEILDICLKGLPKYVHGYLPSWSFISSRPWSRVILSRRRETDTKSVALPKPYFRNLK